MNNNCKTYSNYELELNSYMPVKIISGKGCVRQHINMFSSFGKSCLIVTGQNSARLCGAFDDVIFCLEQNNISYSVFDKIEQNPQTKTCFSAGKAAREISADFIIGIGGGSPLDAAKAVAIYAKNPEFEHLSVYTRAIPAKRLPVVLIGTTAGTGSEVTGVSVLTNSESGRKKSISGEDCYALVSFCDYCYTMSVPNTVTRSTAYDAFSHAVESYFASSSNGMSQMYAIMAIKLLRSYIIAADANTPLSENERNALYSGSIYAGLAINITGTCFPHTLGYYLTESFGVPHGFACAAFMPVLFERAKKYCPEKIRTILQACETDENTLLNKLNNIARQNIRIPISEAGATAMRWQNGIKNFERSPGGFTTEDAEKALCSLYEQ